jgi:hypothetical protein
MGNFVRLTIHCGMEYRLDAANMPQHTESDISSCR